MHPIILPKFSISFSKKFKCQNLRFKFSYVLDITVISAFNVNAAGGGIVGTAVHVEHANKSVTG